MVLGERVIFLILFTATYTKNNFFSPSDVKISKIFWLLTDLEFYDEDTEDAMGFHVIWLGKRLFPITFLIYGNCKYCEVN